MMRRTALYMHSIRKIIAILILTELKPFVFNNSFHGVFAQYKELADAESKVIFGGRLGEYKYYDMDAVVAAALDCAANNI